MTVRSPLILIEQPGSSMMYDLSVIKALISAFGLILVKTYMGFFVT
jgi:hypothetical protein